MAGCEAGMCKIESLKDGTLDLADCARMNDTLLVRAENERIARKRAEESRVR